MATLKRNTPAGEPETPSQALVRAAVQPEEITDSAGRLIQLRKPGPLAQYRLVEAAGESAENRVYMGMILPLVYVAAIDGIPVAAIQNKAHIEALIQRLDEHGITAVMDGVSKHYGRQDPEADKAALKN